MVELRVALLLVISVLHLFSISVHCAVRIDPDSCPTDARFKLTNEEPDSFGLVRKNGEVFPPESIWVEDGETFGCSCYHKPCLLLCCPFGNIVHNRVCKTDDRAGLATFPVVVSDNLEEDREYHVNTGSNFRMVVQNPCKLKNDYSLNPNTYPKENYHLLKNGSIYLPNNTGTTIYNSDSYCLAVVDVYNFTTYVPRVCAAGKPEHIAVVMGIGMIISIPFFIITFVIYTILPEMRNVHGLTLRGYVGSLAVAYTCFTVVQTSDRMAHLPCTIFAYVIQFSFLASFFWLNIMCFDIWWKFGRIGLIRINAENRENKRRLIYSIYVWGGAALLMSICAIIDNAPGIPDAIIRPELGINRCWFKTEKAKALYLFIPMGITIFANIILFLLTVIKITRDKRETGRHLCGIDSSTYNDNKILLRLYIKLFIVMGLNWSMEIASWYFKGSAYLWYIPDLVNMLQGVLIFVIFICNRKVKRLLVKRFHSWKKSPDHPSGESIKNSDPSAISISLRNKDISLASDPKTENTE